MLNEFSISTKSILALQKVKFDGYKVHTGLVQRISFSFKFKAKAEICSPVVALFTTTAYFDLNFFLVFPQIFLLMVQWLKTS